MRVGMIQQAYGMTVVKLHDVALVGSEGITRTGFRVARTLADKYPRFRGRGGGGAYRYVLYPTQIQLDDSSFWYNDREGLRELFSNFAYTAPTTRVEKGADDSLHMRSTMPFTVEDLAEIDSWSEVLTVGWFDPAHYQFTKILLIARLDGLQSTIQQKLTALLA